MVKIEWILNTCIRFFFFKFPLFIPSNDNEDNADVMMAVVLLIMMIGIKMIMMMIIRIKMMILEQ